MIRQTVSQNRHPKARKPRGIAIGVERKVCHLRFNPCDHMAQKRGPSQRLQPLVPAAHTTRQSTSKDHGDRRGHRCTTRMRWIGSGKDISDLFTFAKGWVTGYASDMTSTTGKSPFWLGFRDALPFLLVVAPFAFLFGVVAADVGLDMLQIIAMSITVFAGASQFTALQLMQEAAPVAIVVITAMAVNLRLVMYSAALTPHLGHAVSWRRVLISYFLVDQTYALSVVRFEDQPQWSLPQKTAYYFGVIAPLYPAWMIASILGALLGTTVPEWLALDFAVPICFLAVVGPMLRSAAHVAAAFVSVALALALAWMPYGTGLLVAAIAAMMAGAQVELWRERARGDD